MDEFNLIARYFAPLAAEEPAALGLTDDVALLSCEEGGQLAVTTDAIVEGVHFFGDEDPALIAKKLLRVNLSDLASKGARPYAYLLTAILPPRAGEAFVARFAEGLAQDQHKFGICLVGGDTVATSGPLSFSITALGRVKSGCTPLRSSARPGDAIFVTGTIGDAYLGLKYLRGEIGLQDTEAKDFLVCRYQLPEPRLQVGEALAGHAHAMMDVSDGLIGDLTHICECSGVGARLFFEAIPFSPAFRKTAGENAELFIDALGGGDDYELLFTAPRSASAEIQKAALQCGVPVLEIGEITGETGVTVFDAKHQPVALRTLGFRHFVPR